jgi:transposase
MMKVKQKISGGFRCIAGATDFATIRSFIATAKKQGWNIIQAIAQSPSGNFIKDCKVFVT